MARSTGRKRFWFQQSKDESNQQIIEQKDAAKEVKQVLLTRADQPRSVKPSTEYINSV